MRAGIDTGFTRIIVQEKLGCAPARCACGSTGGRAKGRLTTLEFLAQAKVGHEHPRLAVFAHVDQDVLWLQVAMDDSQAVEMADAVRDLVEDARKVGPASVRQLPIQMRPLNHICERRGTALERDIEESIAHLLRVIPNDCQNVRKIQGGTGAGNTNRWDDRRSPLAT